ncbi:p-hydroxybenzoic acid efflux pump subunit AaeA [Paraburkholderia domus]|uniref:efflux RND transporter periplasmic adaptor subunit n=1 Tax=Paraburkholderia domus TaxID=2793075 RepID=UPI001912901D|nr:efflux RND transporter periplasmic adaptor subunit [Paraburkholderia domus]MBK5061233.1 efflux RND transporter periplasmic adaptor subunit [Burkholderia sp. R-70199]MBK5090681.1 efflux RND transporter periplasmic adaptor subunit [Burkholderia sp. R-69927]CAE6885172.1 p-hydroxybenzoic acid efflux pump subunit AaeA [Paraburkholderia domus]CAE6921466.1 p-hydroxybenzoic acid efflux pump subunit AaeA [Paraburkholderia domus]
MKKTWFSVSQILLTLIVVVVAAFVLWKLVAYYMFAPWTRDGHVRADVIQVAPDISGLISSVDVADNQQVKQGQVLFVIDQARYALALRQAQATAQQRRATLDQARREDARNRQLGNLVAAEVAEESRSRVETAEAALADANVAIDTAKLNLQRTTIVSPVDGYLNDRAPRTGEFVSAGRAVLSVVDMHSFRVDGYFEETKMRGIDIGQLVDIQVMGEPKVLRGHVQSIVAGIEDRDRTQGSNLLPNVNPAFSWVRLAQRIPVRVALDEVPADFRMIAGRTATVSVRDLSPTGKKHPDAGASGTVDASAASTSATSSALAPSAVPATSATSAAQPASAAVISGASQ